jgi:hypothetical protein
MTALHQLVRPLCAVLTPLVLLATLFTAIGPAPAGASSHREAPLISSDPDADGTDFYMFVSPDAPDTVTIIANYIPFSAPEGAPNFNSFSPNVLYEIKLDTVGDGEPHVTYQFEFSPLTRVNEGAEAANPLIPQSFLYNTGPVTSLDDPDLRARQTYTVTEIVSYEGSSPVTTVLASDLPVPPPNIGSKSTPNYAANLVGPTVQAGTLNVGGDQIKVFAGPRDDPFWVDLGSIFDLLSLRPQGPPIGYPTGPTPGLDSLAGFNSYSLALQLPIERLFRGAPEGETVVAGWTTASRRTTKVLYPIADVLTNPSGGPATAQEVYSGPYVQVSRLGMPLTNEAVIPVVIKDAFNNLPPSLDATLYTATSGPLAGPGALLQEAVENPELGRLLCALYDVPLPRDPDNDCNVEVDRSAPPGSSGRVDIFKIFLTGMTLTEPFTINTGSGPVVLPAGFVVNQPTAGSGILPYDALRLNTAISGATCSPTPSRLGILGGDACGFPNGRRLTDDVVEIELLAVAGAAFNVLAPAAENFNFNPALIDILDDGVDGNDRPYLASFPYLATPHQGQEHLHTNLYRQFAGLTAR